LPPARHPYASSLPTRLASARLYTAPLPDALPILPAIVAAKGIHELADGTEVSVDAGLGTITDEITEEHHRFAAAWTELQENPLTYEGGGGVLADGTRVQLLANIGNAADAQEAAAAHADGVGL